MDRWTAVNALVLVGEEGLATPIGSMAIASYDHHCRTTMC